MKSECPTNFRVARISWIISDSAEPLVTLTKPVPRAYGPEQITVLKVFITKHSLRTIENTYGRLPKHHRKLKSQCKQWQYGSIKSSVLVWNIANCHPIIFRWNPGFESCLARVQGPKIISVANSLSCCEVSLRKKTRQFSYQANKPITNFQSIGFDEGGFTLKIERTQYRNRQKRLWNFNHIV